MSSVQLIIPKKSVSARREFHRSQRPVAPRRSIETLADMRSGRMRDFLPHCLPPPRTKKAYSRELQPKFSRCTLLKNIEAQFLNHDNLFNRIETSLLAQFFMTTARERGVDSGMTYSEFENFLFGTLGITDPVTLEGLCRAASVTQANESHNKRYERFINLTGFIRTLSILLRGDTESKARLAFEVLDLDCDGRLQSNIEMKMLLRACVGGIDDWEASRDFHRYIRAFFDVTPTTPLTEERFVKMAKEKPFLIDAALPIIPSPLAIGTMEFLLGLRGRPRRL